MDITQRPYRRGISVALSDLPTFRRYVEVELAKIEAAMMAIEDAQTYVLAALPAVPLRGMSRYFEANVVSPGSAEGFYGYDGAAWKQYTLV
jgi:hypothetical protein